ncbi:MAG: MATE family efflux transporter, partial [Oscillospiraceae bacterium]|nr:MATE family efflux transporter [Oscillospiraceae bacterium]
YVACPYALCGIMDTMVGSLRGLGYSIGPMIVSLIGACGLRIVWIFTIFQIDRTPENLYISYPISWLVTGAVHILFFLYVRKKAFARVRAESDGDSGGEQAVTGEK